MKCAVLFCVIVLTRTALCANILGLFYMCSYSHFTLGETLLKELARKGHNVTMVSPFPQKAIVNNYRDIPITEIKDMMAREHEGQNMFDMTNMPSLMIPIIYGNMGHKLTELVFQLDNVQKLLHSSETFDLVIIEQFLNEAQHGFAHHFKAPLIILSTLGSSMWTNHFVGNPTIPSYMPDLLLSYSPNMNFLQRTFNSIFAVVQFTYNHLYYFPKHNQILHKYIPDAPDIYDLMANTSLILLNSHASYKAPVPHVPNMVEIGGFHVKEPKKLPEDLQKFLDNAKEGVIYFSMGSNLQSKDLPPQKREAILKVFSRLNMKVLWKWEDEKLPGQPANVKVAKWLPQQDLLAHENVKIMITHGGLLTTIEAVYHGIPLLGIPIFGDQKMNMAGAVNGGYAVQVPYSELDEKTLGDALKEITENPRYANNAKMRSKVMKDRPMKPIDSAVYWVEYVLRHKGAHHFRSAALDLNWYQYFSLDVIVFLTLVTVALFIIFYIIIKKLLGRSKKVKLKKN